MADDDGSVALRALLECECGFYPSADGAVIVFFNQGGVCLFRQRVELRPELSGEARKSLTISTLQALQLSVRLVVKTEVGSV